MAVHAKHIYERWRHGGWYVLDVQYPSGATGCVTNNSPDKKWRIACDERQGDFTYPSREAAADAEAAIAAQKRRAAATPDLLWLVERAAAIRSATDWTKAERDRSWADWDAKRAEALAKINPVEG